MLVTFISAEPRQELLFLVFLCSPLDNFKVLVFNLMILILRNYVDSLYCIFLPFIVFHLQISVGLIFMISNSVKLLILLVYCFFLSSCNCLSVFSCSSVNSLKQPCILYLVVVDLHLDSITGRYCDPLVLSCYPNFFLFPEVSCDCLFI